MHRELPNSYQQHLLHGWRHAPWFSVASLLVFASLCPAAEPPAAGVDPPPGPLYERDPFDRVTLNADNQSAVLDVHPLTVFPNRVVPPRASWPKEGMLKFRLVGKGMQEFELAWITIDRIELFESLLISEANRLVIEKDYDAAFSYFEYVIDHFPRTPGLPEALENFYFQHAGDAFRAGRADEALSLLDEAAASHPASQRVPGALARVTESLLEKYRQAENYSAVRDMLARTAARYPEAQKPLIDKWNSGLAQLAGQQMTLAREHLAAGRFREAHAAARKMRGIWPDLAGGAELFAEVSLKYPLVEVAVEILAPTGPANRLDHAGARRADRLTTPRLLEYTGYGPDGGEYRCPIGTVVTSDDQKEMIVRLKRDAPWTAIDLLQRLSTPSALSDPTDLDAWQRLAQRVEVSDVSNLRILLRQPHVRPNGLLQLTLDGDAAQTYSPVESAEAEVRFALPAARPALSPGEPREVVERRFRDGRTAVRALERGEIDVVEHLPLTQVTRLRENKSLVVEAYGVPALHVLVPNFRRPLPANRVFRRAFEYALDREEILKQTILGGTDFPGCRVISGPFSPGMQPDDPLSAGYNPQVAPRPYEPRLATALRAIAESELTKQAKAAGQPAPKFGNLVLVHPAGDVPRAASQAIAAAWGTIGLTVEVRELPPDQVDDPSGDYDFRYAILRLQDPVLDANRLLGRGGLLGIDSPYLARAVRQVELAKSGLEARDRLREVHRLAHEEVAVISLWQLVDFMAYRATLGGVGVRPASLYQNIERWQVAAPARASN